MNKLLLPLTMMLMLIFSAGPALCADEPPSWMTGIETPEAVPTSEIKPAETVPVPQGIFFSDVPGTHWAKGAVYALVNMGITQGYPDGTFRGDKNISRYETALFLSRMGDLIILKQSETLKGRQKDFDENYAPKLKAELDEIKKEIEMTAVPETPRPEYGYFEGRLRVSNLTTIGSKTQTAEVAGGPMLDYRLKMKFSGNINKWLYGEANLDTMDAGWGGGPGRSLSEGLVDVTARIRSPYGFDAFVAAGPGPVVHTEEAGSTFISENGLVFMRPRNSFGLVGDLYGALLTASYSSLLITRTGESTVSNFQLKVGYDFDEDTVPFGLNEIAGTVDYDRIEGDALGNLTHQKLFISFKPKWGFELNVAGGASSVHDSLNNYYYELGLKFKDLLTKGMLLELSGLRNGKDYINSPSYLAEESMLGLDYFDKFRYVRNGGANAGLKITYDASPVTRIKASGVFVLDDSLSYGEDDPGTHATFEIGIDYKTYTYSTFGFIYRVYHEPSLADLATSDMMALNAKYEF